MICRGETKVMKNTLVKNNKIKLPSKK